MLSYNFNFLKCRNHCIQCNLIEDSQREILNQSFLEIFQKHPIFIRKHKSYFYLNKLICNQLHLVFKIKTFPLLKKNFHYFYY